MTAPSSANFAPPDAAAVPMATPLNYQIPIRKPRIAAAVGLMCGGLALIFLGGCFLIGVAMDNSSGSTPNFSSPPSAPPLLARDLILISVLYGLGFACFLAAAFLLFLSVRGFLRAAKD